MTKPAGSLGRLESLVRHLAALQNSEVPASRPAVLLLFASDHPVAAHGVSAYPQDVTRTMLHNLRSGGAAAAVLARRLGVPLEVHDVGVLGGEAAEGEGVRIRRGPPADMPVGDLVSQDAMPEATMAAAWEAGAEAVRALPEDTKVVLLGELGIGNTTPATAVASALLAESPLRMTGRGTGLDDAGVRRKVRVVERALDRVRAEDVFDPRTVLRQVGGRDLAALAGAVEAAGARRVAVLLDGFIVSTAALVVARMDPAIRAYLMAGHRSRERGHVAVLDALRLAPLLSLDLALGEGSGALLALPLLDAACALHRDMATFGEAQVPGPE